MYEYRENNVGYRGEDRDDVNIVCMSTGKTTWIKEVKIEMMTYLTASSMYLHSSLLVYPLDVYY